MDNEWHNLKYKCTVNECNECYYSEMSSVSLPLAKVTMA